VPIHVHGFEDLGFAVRCACTDIARAPATAGPLGSSQWNGGARTKRVVESRLRTILLHENANVDSAVLLETLRGLLRVFRATVWACSVAAYADFAAAVAGGADNSMQALLRLQYGAVGV